MGVLLVLLNILKIIGIILLIILILIVTLLCIVLFVPFVYNIEGKKYQHISGEGFIKWLFGIICLEFVYSNGKTNLVIKVFGRNIEDIKKNRANKKRDNNWKKTKKKKGSKNNKIEKPQVRVVAAEKKLDDQLEVEESTVLKEQPVIIAEPEIVAMGRLSEEMTIVKRVKLKKIEEEILKEIIVEKKEENKRQDRQDEEKKINGNDGRENVVKEKIDIEYFKKLPWDEKKKIFKACTTLLKRLLRGISPNSIYIDATIGTGDPELTGYVLAMAAIARGTINSNINVRGKFDQEFFEGEIRLAGEIKMFNIISAAAKFIFTKAIYKIWKTYLKGRGE
ncbi:MAG: hypothetical protein VB018_10710 [Lachnospiraceae bacterium]|nr:hypothetical protein [Lachnospiraceae bacterium]